MFRTETIELVFRGSELHPSAVFATVKSAKRMELNALPIQDLMNVLVFCVYPFEYNGEQLVRYKGTTYAVLKTYDNPRTGEMELTAKERVGAQ